MQRSISHAKFLPIFLFLTGGAPGVGRGLMYAPVPGLAHQFAPAKLFLLQGRLQ